MTEFGWHVTVSLSSIGWGNNVLLMQINVGGLKSIVTPFSAHYLSRPLGVPARLITKSVGAASINDIASLAPNTLMRCRKDGLS